MQKPEQHFAQDSVPCTTVLLFSLFLWNMGLTFRSLKDQLTKDSSFYPSLVMGKKPKSLAFVNLVLADNARAVSFQHQYTEIHLVTL